MFASQPRLPREHAMHGRLEPPQVQVHTTGLDQPEHDQQGANGGADDPSGGGRKVTAAARPRPPSANMTPTDNTNATAPPRGTLTPLED